jgi:hypothetical protein
MARLKDGISAVKVAASLKLCYPTITSWLKHFKAKELHGLKDKTQNGSKIATFGYTYIFEAICPNK